MDDGKAARDASAAAGTETADMCDAGGLATPGVPRLIALWVYPVKSCAGMRVTMWPVAPHGLLLDREWAVVTPAGKALRQKEALGLCRVQPAVDWVAGVLHLTEDGTAGDALALPLGDAVLQAAASAGLRPAVGTAREFSDAHQDGSVDGGHRRWRSVRVCGVRCEAEVDDCPAVRDWLTKRVGQACTLARRPTHTNQAAEAATSGTAGATSVHACVSDCVAHPAYRAAVATLHWLCQPSPVPVGERRQRARLAAQSGTRSGGTPQAW